MDKSAIEHIQAGEATLKSNAAITSAFSQKQSIAFVHSDMEEVNIERHLPHRARARGVMSSCSIEHFAAYCKDHALAGATAFADPRDGEVSAVLNLGTQAEPGHGDWKAIFRPQKTAAYKSLTSNQIVGNRLSQQSLSEWCEDWRDHIKFFSEETTLSYAEGINAIRNITIEQAKKAESTMGQLSSKLSTLESVSASSKGTPVPTHIYFECEPYQGFSKRTFALRIAVYLGEKLPAFALKLINEDLHKEEIAKELADKVTQALRGVMPVYLGTYTPSA